jgi:hypothetical protein
VQVQLTLELETAWFQTSNLKCVLRSTTPLASQTELYKQSERSVGRQTASDLLVSHAFAFTN